MTMPANSDIDAKKRARKMADYYATVSNNMTDKENDTVFSLSSTINTTTGIYLALALGILSDPERLKSISTESSIGLYASLFLFTISLILGIAWHLGSKGFFHDWAQAAGDLSNALDKVATKDALDEINEGQFRQYKMKRHSYGKTIFWLQILLFFGGLLLTVIYLLSLTDFGLSFLRCTKSVLLGILNLLFCASF